ncbi:MAG TPA: M48 family metallopeptidase [Terriglobales bacterium]|nr:M48 family metallopeptidase [Terriglobales bacterium]
MNVRPFRQRILAACLTLLLTQPSWLLGATTGPELPDPGTTSITRDQQIQLGRQASAEVYKQMPVLPDSSALTQYVRRVGEKLVAQIPQEYSWPYEFHVIPEKEINAFALPGGPMFVNAGAIVAADNEAQLAGVMAHEMSHVYMQHSAKQASKQAFTNGILGVLGAIVGGGTAGTLARLGMQIGAGAISLKYSRNDEAQADAVGAIIMYKAGYDPRALAQFFEKLESEGSSGPQFLSDHPDPGNRSAAIDKEIAEWPSRNYQNNSQAFVQAKQEASHMRLYTAQEIADGAKQGRWAQQNSSSGATPANLPAPTSDSQGSANPGGNANISSVTPQQVKPSSNLQPLQHNAFTISYPDNWQVFGDPNSNVTIAPSAGVGQNAIAYGVVIGGSQDQNADSLDQATQDLIQNLQQSNQNLRVSGSARTLQVNGVDGRSVFLTGTSPVEKNGKPLSERDWLVTLPRPQGGLLYLIFIAPQNSFNQFRPTYQRMLNTLQLR